MAGEKRQTANTERIRLDTSSIKMTTIVSFVIFAIVLITLFWCLFNYFIGTYYQTLRTQEVINTASMLETQYRQNRSGFDEYALQTAGANGIYIRIDSEESTLIYDGTSALKSSGEFSSDISMIRIKLSNSPLGSVTQTELGNTTGDGSRLLYGSRLNIPGENVEMYIIAPLYPDQATIRILRNMLIYISVILLAIAFMLSYALSRRISAPIENITRSAKELSKGNYNIRFDGAQFTETKELARALNKASYEMDKTDFYQREIIANVSHDLKTPLTMIRSYAEKIIDISGDNPEKRNADLHIIISETERLNRLVTDMMSVSNLQSNNVELHKETFDLVKAAEEVYESFMVLSDSEDYDMHFHPCKPSYIVGDRSRLMQVMSNFISNAVKYSGDNKYIDIQLVRRGRIVSFHCIDHGVGIPSDEISHVWDKYYRTSANHERGIEGTGLGLAIVKGILTLHNAAYGVESEEGKGSDFWFEMETVRKPPARNKAGKDGKDNIEGREIPDNGEEK